MNEITKLTEFATRWAIDCQQTSAYHAARASAAMNLLRSSNYEHFETIEFAIEQQDLARVWARRSFNVRGLFD